MSEEAETMTGGDLVGIWKKDLKTTAMKKTRYQMDGGGAYLGDETDSVSIHYENKTILSEYPAPLPEDPSPAHPALDCELRLH